MADKYLYGAYGHIGQTVAQTVAQALSAPVCIGTAPVNLIRGYGDAGVINEPVKVSGLLDMQKKLGYSADFAAFTLCETAAAHYDSAAGAIGPFYAINVLDPDIHRKPEQTTLTLAFSGGKAELVSDRIILDTLTVLDAEGEKLTEGADYAVDYNFTKGAAVITGTDKEHPLSGAYSAAFYEADPALVSADDIIGTVSADGVYSGIAALPLLYSEHFTIANLILAPGFSQIPAVYRALIAAGQKLNGHWSAFTLADLPLDGVDTIEKAVAWKRENTYTSERSKVFWPQAVDSAGRVFHLSTLAAVELLRADETHGGVPMETCGNKEVPVIRQYFGVGAKNRGFDQQAGNELTQNGISTVVPWAGQWVLWGDHTAAYIYGQEVDKRAIFDVSVRMLMHIINDFQQEWSPQIDQPMTRAFKDRIINREQEKLDAYVSMGALIGAPSVLFLESENSREDIVNGDFRWDMAATPTPPLKSSSLYVSYTDAGFSVYYEEEGESA